MNAKIDAIYDRQSKLFAAAQRKIEQSDGVLAVYAVTAGTAKGKNSVANPFSRCIVMAESAKQARENAIHCTNLVIGDSWTAGPGHAVAARKINTQDYITT